MERGRGRGPGAHAAFVLLAMCAIVLAAFMGAAHAAESPPSRSAGNPMDDVGTVTDPSRPPYSTDASGNRGYWVFVCQAAYEAGYRGKLNKAFIPKIDDWDMYVNESNKEKKVYPSPKRYTLSYDDPTLSIVRRDSSATDLGRAIDVWDDCDSSKPASARSFGIRRDPAYRNAIFRWDAYRAGKVPYHSNGDGYTNLRTNGYSQGKLGVTWYVSFDKGTSLEARQIYVRDDIRVVRPREESEMDGRDTDHRNWNPGFEGGWVVSRDLRGERSADQFRYCRYGGVWADGRYHNTWWKDITSAAEASHGESWLDDNFSTQLGGSRSPSFFKENPSGRDPDKRAREYWDFMTGSGSNGNPNSRCNFRYDGESEGSYGEWYWSDRGQRVNGFSLTFSCQEKILSQQECRGLGGTSGLQDGASAIANVDSFGSGVRASGVLIFMLDTARPRVTITGGSLDRNGGAITRKPTTVPDDLRFTATDDSGIRRVRITVTKPDGSVATVRNAYNTAADGLTCDYRYIIPCAGGLGGSPTDDEGEVVGSDTPSNTPAWVPAVQRSMMDPFLLNGQELPLGNYTVTVTAWDASNQSASDTATFRVVDPPRILDCAGADAIVGAPQDTCGSTGNVCGTVAACNPTSGSATENGPATTSHPDPTTGPAIFSYALAFNPTATGTAPAGGGCRVIESVIRGNGEGGGLNDREKNQIISVTLDFSGFSTLGQSLGTQDLKSTFDLPARRDSRYRSALGCPG